MPFKSAILYILLSAAIIPAGFAQQSLTLNEAIERALKNNFQIKIAKANVEIAANNNTIGQAGMLPSLNYNLLSNNSYNVVDNPAAFLRGEFLLNSLRNNVDLSWTIFNGFRAHIEKDRLEKLVDLSMGNAAVVVENTIQGTILSYNLALLEKERLEVMRGVLQLSRDRFNYVRERQKLGTAGTFDLLVVKNNMLSDSTAFLMQQINYNNSLRELNLILAEDVSAKLIPVDALAPVNQLYDFENLRQKMLSNNSTLRNQFINLEILRKEVSLVSRERMPRLNLNSGTNFSDNRVNHENFRGRGEARDYYVNFSLSFNLYNGGRTRNAIQNARISEQILTLTNNEMEQSMINRLYSLHELYNARTAILSLSKENYQSAEVNLKLAEDRFRGGTITSFEYREVQLNYMNSAQAYLSSIFDQIETHTELLRLTGGIISE
jgi:outer membrane protein